MEAHDVFDPATTNPNNDLFARENGITEEDVQEAVEEVIPTEYRDTQDRFANLMSNRRSQVIREIEEEVAEKQRIHDNYVRSQRNVIWEMNDLRNKREALMTVEDQTNETFKSQFDALLRHSMVQALGLRGDMLLVKTNDLDMTDPHTGESKHLGQMEIELPLVSSALNYLKVTNVTNARTNPEDGMTWQHPHIGEHREPCFGSLETEMMDSLSGGEITAAFELLLQYLQTYNPDDDYGSHWGFWD